MASRQNLTHQITFGRPQKKSVLVLYTGGTLGMKPDATGALSPVPGFLTQHMASMPEIKSPEMPIYDIIEYDPLIDSSDMGPDDWAHIADDIEANYYKYDGFVVICGTDTMAYAASALSFMLENLAKAVIFTGSQIPFHEVHNDARKNLIVSMILATREDFLEVCICFHDRLLRGNRASKMSSFRVDAFDSPNFPRLAEVGVNILTRDDLALPIPRAPFRAHKNMETSIQVFKLVPGFDDQCLLGVVSSGTVKALILEFYGTGNAPNRKRGLLEALHNARAQGIIVVARTQCASGGVLLDKYAVGKALIGAGVIPAGDMTTEACATKLGFLLANTDGSHETMRRFMMANLRGELTPEAELRRSLIETIQPLSASAAAQEAWIPSAPQNS